MTVGIKLMPDYACYPLWWEGNNRVGNINPATLPLSQETIDRLHRWADAYDATLNWDDPANSPGFLSREAEDFFEQEGINLWKQLQKELPLHFKVYYFSSSLSKLIYNFEELEERSFTNWYPKFSKQLLSKAVEREITNGSLVQNENGQIGFQPYEKPGEIDNSKQELILID